MIVIKARNAHAALRAGIMELLAYGRYRESRNGRVLKFNEPVTTVYEKPTERVVFWKQRDANPFFHFAEALWMLAGRNDVAFVANFAKQMLQYSDDELTLGGAYGYRWRRYFVYDQLIMVIEALRANRDDRRQVLSMWDPVQDLQNQKFKKDVPCNLQAIFSVNDDGFLDMTVTNRSNDMIWGAYGANAVHFSYLQQFVAESLGRPVGRYWQVSNNLHAYDNELLERVKSIISVQAGPELQPYAFVTDMVQPPLGIRDGIHYHEWLSQLEEFLVDPAGAPPGMCWYLRRVALPLFTAHRIYKEESKNPRRWELAAKQLRLCHDTAWALAGTEWLERRQASLLQKRNGENNGET